MNAEPNLEMDQLPFGEYAQRVLADTGARIKFSHLVRSDLTYADIEVKYGEETAINVGIARDPDAHESTDEDFAKARPAIQVDPELVQAYNRGDLRIRPDLVNGPGDALRDHLAAKGITQKQLAKVIGRPANTINQIVLGKKAVTAKTALELEQALGVPAETWMSLEARRQLRRLRQIHLIGDQTTNSTNPTQAL